MTTDTNVPKYGWIIAAIWVAAVAGRYISRAFVEGDRARATANVALSLAAWIATFVVIRRWLKHPARRRARPGDRAV